MKYYRGILMKMYREILGENIVKMYRKISRGILREILMKMYRKTVPTVFFPEFSGIF